ncbi:MAG: lipopolysaccharide biosynthesis protein [Planctomycetota bacterium]
MQDTEQPNLVPDPKNRWFETHDLHKNLGQRTARGGAVTLGTTSVNSVVTTVSTVLVTRNLTDEDFGLYGMVIVLTGFASMFVDLGLSRAVIQKPQVNHAQVSTLFWINLGIAVCLAIFVAAATPLIVWFYSEPRLTTINLVMAGLFILSGLGLQHRALLTRRMEYGRLNLIQLAAAPTASLTAVVIAFLGGGYWALVALPAVSQLVTVVGTWIACPWVPGLPRRGAGVRTMLAFGGNVTGFQFINYFARNADNAMLGFAWGAGPLGLYTRAYSLMMLPVSKLNSPLTNVVVPALSRVAGRPETYRNAYRSAIAVSAGLTTPAILFFIVLSPELVPLLLGPQWVSTVPILFALSGAALAGATNAAAGWVYLSWGHTGRMFRWAQLSAVQLFLVLAVSIGHGPLGVALGISIHQLILKIPALAYAVRGTPLRVSDFLGPAAFPTLAALISGAAALGIDRAVPPGSTGPATMLAVKTAIFCGLYAAGLLATPPGRAHLNAFRQAASLLRSGR